MRKARLRAYCPHCHHRQIFVKVHISHWAHFALSLVTLGLWLVSWVSICIGAYLRPWRCEHCGWHSPEADRPTTPKFPIKETNGPTPPKATEQHP